MVRLPQFGVLTPELLRPVGSFLFFISAYFQFFQCLSHTWIAFNRYTVIVVPFRHDKASMIKFVETKSVVDRNRAALNFRGQKKSAGWILSLTSQSDKQQNGKATPKAWEPHY